jgi:hypothetical protein
MAVTIVEDVIMNALFARDQHLDTSLYVPHTVGSGNNSYKFYTSPNFIVILKKDIESVKDYMSKNGMEELFDMENMTEDRGVVLIELGWEDPKISKKLKDMEYSQKKK